MNKRFIWRFGLVLAVFGLSLYAMLPLKEKIRLGLDLKGGTQFLLQMDLSEIDITGQGDARAEAIEILRKRVDKFGVAEPLIQPVGGDRIEIQLPGLEEKFREEARKTIERTAFLEFRLVHEDNDNLLLQSVADPGFVPPVGYQKLRSKQERQGQVSETEYFVKVRPELTGRYVDRAFTQFDNIGRPEIALQFNDEGAEIFGRVTTANVGRQLAIVLDGELYSAPVIQDAIMGGRAQISGQFTVVEAQQLANVLENPLEAPVRILEERGVDPSLGKDSIRSGIRAALIGAIAVVVFMAIYYMFAGVVADIALMLNIVILLGVLSIFEFTLTLPGIAGIVLTIGMAVDANVLIYERIREELALNKSLRSGILAGYQRAFVVILDSNLTTIMAALILIWLGSGPVKGFGVTLTIGLLANLFAAVFVTRWIFDWLAVNGRMKSFNMLHILGATKIDFMGVRKFAFAASWALIIAGLISFVSRGGLGIGKGEVYGIDFAGGDSVTMSFAQRVDTSELRNVLVASGLEEVSIQYQREIGTGSEVISLKLPEGASGEVVSRLQTSFPEAQLTVLSTERVGAVVGKELLKRALLAVGLALVAIMIYVAFRFGEFAYGLGAVAALAHDILMSVGWFCLTGRNFSIPVVAALLTIIGYSINDTIVVFDRVRENRKLGSNRKLNYIDLLNRSINQTLSRTILTAGTVFIATIALYLFGGHVINDLAFTFMVGVITGTYSSIYIASPIVLWYHRGEAARAAKAAAKAAEPASA